MFSISPLSKFFTSALLILLLCTSAKAQDFMFYSFELPTNKVSNSLYNKITLVDRRLDTITLGKLGTKDILVRDLPVEFNNILTALTDGSAKQQPLLIQLRAMSFGIGTKKFSGNGYFNLRAALFIQKNNSYLKIGSIDTVLIIKSTNTKKILSVGHQLLNNFIAANLTKEPANDITYNNEQVFKVDSLEKSKFKLYSTNTYADGAYISYNSFRDQMPDSKIKVDGDILKKNSVKMPDTAGVWRKIKMDSVYAIVHMGKPYIVTQYGLYQLKKINYDFGFIGKGNVNTGNNISMGMMYGAIGGLAGALIGGMIDNETATYEIKIDYNTGQLVRIKEVIEDELTTPATTPPIN